MPAPTPIVATPPDFLELPAGGTYQFNGSGSTPGASYSWTLVEWPPEATSAQLTNANTATPTLINITARGTYIVFLKVTNSFGESHPYPYPTQATTAPYGFSTPLATAFGVLRIAEAGSDALNPIFKPGRGEYGWFEKGLWPLVKKVSEGLTFEYYDIPTRTLTANAIVPDPAVTPFDDIVSVAGLNVRDDSTQTEHEIYNSYDKINVLSHMHVTGKDLTVSGGTLKADTISDASGGDVTITANSALRLEPTNGVVVDTTTVNITAAYDVTFEMVGAIDDTLAVTSNGNLQLSGSNAVQIQAQGDGTLALTANNGLISAYGPNVAVEADVDVELRVGSTSVLVTSGDIALSATDDITLTAADDITLLSNGANGDINLTTTGASGDIKLNATGTNSMIALEPTIDTTTTKPLRAPGLVICETAQDKSDTVFSPGNLFTAPPEYTRYSVGSDLDTTIAVAAYAPKDAAIELLLKRTANGSTSTLATISTGALSVAGWCFFNIRCRTKITKDGHTFTLLSYDTTDATSLGTPTTPGATTTTYTVRSESFTGPVSFQVYASNQLSEYSAQMTCALYNLHTEDVL